MEIVIRALVIFCFLWLITRAVGRSTLGELSTFQLLLYVTMGDLVQQAVTQQDYSVTAGLLAISTFALLTVAISWLQWRFPRSRPITAGRPVLVWRDGGPIEETMRDERLAVADVLVAAREQGIRSTGEIEYAVLEADGRLSFFTRESSEDGAPETAPET
ncbi:DUF421 domain-containing protein [Nocardioides sp.]|jgi:uncharacterized membrane protein YcaP (DUF421 family)|uniref:DUF421 domain-containing protein n=1 Tax=Nocardioides sp. TaxID=35761 RepID=UPI002B949982|nr:YetF domain-containing protein [Nocardioides sp.]HVX54460.1 YetF domain-containing protein [Nocardioides sp.]